MISLMPANTITESIGCGWPLASRGMASLAGAFMYSMTRLLTLGASFLFSAKIEQDHVSQSMLGDIVDRVFDGSASALMLSLFDRSDIDADEVRALRRLLDQKAKELKK